MTTLWDTSGRAVVTALAAERRTSGAITTGSVLTLICALSEHTVEQAEQAATIAASNHPMRRLMVVRQPSDGQARLDAEVQVGGEMGPGEVVALRLHGEVAEHAESVVMPLLAPDVPVVTWWHGAPPDRLADDPLAALAQRRITDVAGAPDPAEALRQRAHDFSPGDTDLAWTRITTWRAALACAYDSVDDTPIEAGIIGEATDPTVMLLAGWLSARLNLPVPIQGATSALEQVHLRLAGGVTIQAERDGGRFLLHRSDRPTSIAPIHDRSLGELLTEELRRLDNDDVYAQALGRACGLIDLAQQAGRSASRTHRLP